jgi:hypothetical protein
VAFKLLFTPEAKSVARLLSSLLLTDPLLTVSRVSSPADAQAREPFLLNPVCKRG